MSIYRTTALTVAAIVVSVSVVGADHVLVSRGVTGLNLNPRVAVNETTGDVLIVWTQQFLADSTRSQVWASVLKRRPNGTFKKPRKPRRISPKQGFHSNARVAWLPAKRAFFAVWDTRRMPGVASKILGRKINANGKASGGTRTLASDGRENFGPAIQPDVPVGRIVYMAKGAASSAGIQKGTDVMTVLLNRGLRRDEAETIDELTLIPGHEPSVESFERADTSCQLLIVQQGLGSSAPSIKLSLLSDGDVVVDKDGQPQEVLFPDARHLDSGFQGLPEAKVGNFFAIVLNAAGRARTVRARVIICELLKEIAEDVVDLKRVEQLRAALLVRSLFPDNFTARGPAAFDIVVSVDGKIESQGYNENARPTGLRQTLATDVGNALFLRGATLPVARNGAATAPDAILTWLVGAGLGSEIRALAVKRD